MKSNGKSWMRQRKVVLRMVALLTGSLPGHRTAIAAIHWMGETLELEEHLGRTWAKELIHCDFEFAPGEGRSTDVRMLDEGNQEIPVQRSEIAKHYVGSIWEKRS
jgi:hypothetical protein